ncbi:MAG: queuosine precursor transporter [Massilibacteroides sp.]|nr:queuosine precursor transporter [Massilibacteroides sp.]MDD3063604.1 queuosine precursor transporter [Massilibacteroides sp.]MDD4115356.1 queuosine precursor transporter [Massilibacteroides sp.]MDD4659832.1 queuosine precursor transporter [Massilibacteroides sp.]
MQTKVSVPFMLLGILFNLCLLTSNLLETKVVQIFGLTTTAGLIVFPISYIINDCIAEVWGFKKARLIIWSGFASNFLLIAFAQIAIQLPTAPFWEGEEAFNFIFGLAPRIAVASLIAFLAGSFINAYVMSKMKIASQGKHFSVRAILSTLAGESVDSLIFFPIAFVGLVPMDQLLIMIATQAVLKSLYEVIILPVTIRVVKYIKKTEGMDVYDRDISYNILKIKDL